MIALHTHRDRSDQSVQPTVQNPAYRLVALTGLLETRAVVPVLVAIYPLAEVPDALDHFGTGEVEGKLVIQVWTPPPS